MDAGELTTLLTWPNDEQEGDTVKKLLSATLIAIAAFGFATTVAMAGDDDDDHDKWNKRHHRGECKVLMANVVGDTLVIDGTGLTKRSRVPKVQFGGVELVVDPATLTSEHIEADLTDVELADTTKDYLLKVTRSRRDRKCPSHLVTIVRGSVSAAPVGPTKTVFITSVSYDALLNPVTGSVPGACASLTGAARGDCICQAHADIGSVIPSGGTYMAWLSDETSSPSTRFTRSTTPYVNTNQEPSINDFGTVVAEDYIALVNSFILKLENPMIWDENGVGILAVLLTGTKDDGTSLPFGSNDSQNHHCNGWTTTSNNPFGPRAWTGLNTRTQPQWTALAEAFCGNATGSLVCFEQ